MRFEGIKVKDGFVSHKQGSGPVAGVSASVAAAGDIERRITASRLLLAGPFALAMRKKKDHRELFLTIEGQGFAIVLSVKPDLEKKARKFAADLNVMGQRAAAVLPPPPPPPPRSPVPPR